MLLTRADVVRAAHVRAIQRWLLTEGTGIGERFSLAQPLRAGLTETLRPIRRSLEITSHCQEDA